MLEAELLQTLARGEDSQHQFKSDFTNSDALAAELIAIANQASSSKSPCKLPYKSFGAVA